MSDFSNGNSDEVASIYVEACLDIRKLNKELTDLQNQRYNLKIDTVTDESALTGLNRHLESKKNHLAEINSYFSRNAVTPLVNDRALTKLNQQLSNTQSLLEGLEDRRITLKVDVDTDKINKQVEEAVKNAKVETIITLNDENSHKIVSKLDEVLNAQKQQTQEKETPTNSSSKKSTMEEFDPINDKLASKLTNSLNSVGTGFFDRIGGSFGSGIGSGIRKAVEKEFNIDLKGVAEEATKFLIKTYVKKEQYTLPDGMSNSSQGATTSAKKTSDIAFRPSSNQIFATHQRVALQQPLIPLVEPKKVEFVSAINSVPNTNNLKQKATADKVNSLLKTEESKLQEILDNPIKTAFKIINDLSNQKKPDMTEAKTAFANIRTGFSKGYKEFQKSLASGNYDLARVQSESLFKMSEYAKKEVDAIKANLRASGMSTAFGSELSTMAGSTKGVIQSNYIKPTRQKIEQLDKLQSVAISTNQIGVDVVSGLTNGLKNVNPLKRQASILAFTLIDQVKKDLDIHSPSRVFQAIGRFVTQGFQLGIKGGVNGTQKTAKNLVSSTIQSAKSVIPPAPPNFNQHIKNTQQANQSNNNQLSISQSGSQGTATLSFGTKTYFNQMFDNMGRGFRDYLQKRPDVHNEFEARALQGEMAGTGFALASAWNPGMTGAAALSPLALSTMPLLTAGFSAANLLKPLIGKISEAITTTEPITKRFDFLSGTPGGGKQEVDYVRGVSNKYNVVSKSGLDNYSQMTIAARGTKLEGEGVKSLFEGITASIRALNLGTYDSSLIFNAYTQILSKGKLSMEELRQQLGEKFPPAMNVFAKALGVSQGELNELIGKGAILSEDILPKVAKVLKSDFGSAAEISSGSFLAAATRMENAGFDLKIKLAENFSGMFAGFTNSSAGMVEMFTNNFKTISQVGGAFLIGITAQIAVATQTILASPAIAAKSAIIQNALTVGFQKSILTLTPFFAGVLVDIADDFLGAKNSIMSNMMTGITSMITGVFVQIDNLMRDFQGKSMFTPEFGKKETSLFGSMAEGAKSFFSIIPSGLVEMGALVIMFEQSAILGQMILSPMFNNIGQALRGMGAAFKIAATDGQTLSQSLRTFFAHSSMAKAGMQALALASKAAMAVAVIAFARSDFSDPLTTGFNKAKNSMVSSIEGIKASLDGLKAKSVEIGDGIKSSLTLPSKGLEMNPMVWLGLSENSYKSDDYYKARNDSSKKSDLTAPELEYATKKKAEADKLGVGDFFTGYEKDITLSQKQVLNQATDLNKQGIELKKQLTVLNLSPETVANFVTGDVKTNVSELKRLDNQIEKLGKRRSTLALDDLGTKLGKSNLTGYTSAKKEIASTDLEINKLLKERKEKTKPLTSIMGGVDDLKAQLKDQEDSINQSNLPKPAKNALIASLEPQKKLIADSVEYLKSQGLYKLIEPLAEVWQTVIDKLKTAEKTFDKLKKSTKIESLNKQANIYESGLTEPAKKQTLDILNIVELTKAQSALQKLIGVRENSLSKLLTIPNVEQNKEKKEEITNLNENLGKDKEEFATNRAALAQMKSALIQQLRDQTKTVAEYYQTIVRQVKESSIEFQKQLNNINSTKAKANLTSALIGVGDNIITQFVDSLIQNLDDLNSIKNQKLDAQAKMQSTQFQIEDAKKAGFELLKTLPGDVGGFDLVVIDSMNKELNQTVDIVGLITGETRDLNGVLDDSVNNTAKLTEQFESAVKASEEATKATETWKSSIDLIPNSLSNISNGFTGVANTIASLSVQTATWIGSLLNGQSLITNIANTAVATFSGDKSKQPGWVNQVPGLQTGIDAVKGFFNPTSIKSQPFKIVESVGSSIQNVNSFSDLEKHHPSSGREAGRTYDHIDGDLEEIRKTSDGRTLIKKDFVLMDSKGRQNVSLPAPATGYAKANSNFGTVDIYKDEKMTQLIAKILHLSNIQVKTGDFVRYGQSIGTQDGIGEGGKRTYGIHSHVELEKENFIKYIADLKRGLFETSSNMVDTRPANNAVNFTKPSTSQGNYLFGKAANYKPSDLSKLTPTGKKALEALKNPNVRAFLDSVAKAELGDQAADKGGYGYLFGDTGNKETYDPNNLSTHPRKRRKAGGYTSSATGRYQTMDFVYDDDTKYGSKGLGLSDFKPQSQEVLAVGRMMYRGILDQVMKGDISGVLPKAGKEWASIEGNPYGQGTVGGKKSTFLNNFKNALNNQAMSAYTQNKFLTSDQLQAQVIQGTDLQTQTLQTGGQNSAIQSDAEIKLAEKQFQRKQKMNQRTLLRADRERLDSQTQSDREVTDLYIGLNINKTPTESFDVEIQNKIRDREDKIKDKLRKLEDIDEIITGAMNSLRIKGGQEELKGDDRVLVENTLTNALGQEKQLKGDLKGLQIGKALEVNVLTKNFRNTEGFRQKGIEFEERGNDVNRSQMQIEQTKAIIALNGENFDKLTLSIPALEKKNQLMQIDLETEKAISEIQQKLFKNEITSEQADKQIEQAKKLSIVKQETLDYTNQLVEAQAKLNVLQSAADTNKNKAEFLTGSKFTRKQMEIDAYKSRGGNEFLANASSRVLGKEQEDIRYKQELMDFETKQQQLKIQGIDIDPDALASVKADMEAIHNLNMDKLNTDFKTFGMSLDEIARTSIQSLGKGITGLIMGTKSLNDVLDEFFNNILSSVLDQAISSMLGGLIGGGGGLFDGGGSKGGGLGGLLGGLFYDGGKIPNYAMGGDIQNAYSKERSQSGRKPILVMAHEGEMMIPAWRANELASMGLGEKELLGYADGGVIGNIKQPVANRANQGVMEVKYQSTVINNQSYVTSEQFEEGVRKAAQVGAEGGFNKMQNKLSNSSSFRRSVGI